MRKTLFVAAACTLLATPVFARSGGEGNNTNCNGVGNPNSPCVPSAGSNGGAGGAGGQGGRGGTGIGVGVGIAAANARANATAVGLGGNASARGGNARAAGGNATASGGAGGNATVTVEGAGGTYYGQRDRLQAPNVQAPAIWSNNPCVVALSGGVSVAGFGASIGAGIEDRDCTRRALAQHLVSMGEAPAAREVLCENSEVRAAFARVGRPCVADQQQVVPVQAVALPAPAPTPVVRRNLPAYCSVPGIQNSECQ